MRGVPPPCAHDEGPYDDLIGICCSGGGVRSAAYNLGALQVLREQRILGRERVLVSAVSGGSYIAASFATVADRTDWDALGEDAPGVYAPGSPEERHLRNHSSYLAPGSAGSLRLLLRVLLGMLVNFLLIGLMIYVVATLIGWAYGAAY